MLCKSRTHKIQTHTKLKKLNETKIYERKREKEKRENIYCETKLLNLHTQIHHTYARTNTHKQMINHTYGHLHSYSQLFVYWTSDKQTVAAVQRINNTYTIDTSYSKLSAENRYVHIYDEYACMNPVEF